MFAAEFALPGATAEAPKAVDHLLIDLFIDCPSRPYRQLCSVFNYQYMSPCFLRLKMSSL
jgi:hypothetical protein